MWEDIQKVRGWGDKKELIYRWITKGFIHKWRHLKTVFSSQLCHRIFRKIYYGVPPNSLLDVISGRPPSKHEWTFLFYLIKGHKKISVYIFSWQFNRKFRDETFLSPKTATTTEQKKNQHKNVHGSVLLSSFACFSFSTKATKKIDITKKAYTHIVCCKAEEPRHFRFFLGLDFFLFGDLYIKNRNIFLLLHTIR